MCFLFLNLFVYYICKMNLESLGGDYFVCGMDVLMCISHSSIKKFHNTTGNGMMTKEESQMSCKGCLSYFNCTNVESSIKRRFFAYFLEWGLANYRPPDKPNTGSVPLCFISEEYFFFLTF